MSGIINLITEHSSKLNILLIVTLINAIIAILISLLTKRKFIKYIPSLIIGVSALIILLRAFNIFTIPRGLDLAWIAVFLGTAALVGLFVCFIIDLISSIRKNAHIDQQNVPKAHKKATNKRSNAKKTVDNKNKNTATKVRIAQKPKSKNKAKEDLNKYNTKKIYLDPEVKEDKASKVKKLDDAEKITFESSELD